MPGIEERVIRLEERSEAHQRTMNHLVVEMAAVRGEMTAVRGEMTALRGEMGSLRTDVRQEIAELRSTMQQGFTWLVGVQVAALLTMIGALAALFYR